MKIKSVFDAAEPNCCSILLNFHRNEITYFFFFNSDLNSSMELLLNEHHEISTVVPYLQLLGRGLVTFLSELRIEKLMIARAEYWEELTNCGNCYFLRASFFTALRFDLFLFFFFFDCSPLSGVLSVCLLQSKKTQLDPSFWHLPHNSTACAFNGSSLDDSRFFLFSSGCCISIETYVSQDFKLRTIDSSQKFFLHVCWIFWNQE